MSDAQTHCPVHGDPNGPLRRWPCPVAEEGDPSGTQTCEHFVAMIQRQVEEVEAGNFFRRWRDDDGRNWSQEYRNHFPVGNPQISTVRR